MNPNQQSQFPQGQQGQLPQQPDFYSLALAKFLATCPTLGGYIVSFKDISDEMQDNDAGMVVGVFLLRVGMESFFVPVVSRDGNVYPIDSVYCVSDSKFAPLTPRMVDIIITSSKLTQGKPYKIPNTFANNPDVSTLLTPPRTGRFNYASSSRLMDFLASMPDYLKTFVMEKVAEEKSVYEDLHKLFSIQDIFAALKPAPGGVAAVTNKSPISVVTSPTNNLSNDDIQRILNGGYTVIGETDSNRIAVSAIDYNSGKFTHVSALDGNKDHELVFSNGSSREAFIPLQLNIGQKGDTHRKSVALFTNGDYATSESFVTVGSTLDRSQVLETIFGNLPPILPSDVEVGDTFAIIDTSASLLGVFRASKVTLNNLGVEIQASAVGGMTSGLYTLCAYRNYGKAPQIVGSNVYMPYSTLVLKLGENVTFDLEKTVNNAAKRSEVTQAGLLGDQLNISWDNVEFSVNGKVIGSEANLMNKLAVEESINPEQATTFIKQAKERKFVKVYLSKKASTDFQPAEIPQFGNTLAPAAKTGLNGSFMPNVQSVLRIGDAQATEATIISELLQAPDVYDSIEEYLPSLVECTDRLGRILFLSRVNIDKLSGNNDTDSIFSFLASLKAVYRMLGDNTLKLQELVAIRPNDKEQAGV